MRGMSLRLCVQTTVRLLNVFSERPPEGERGSLLVDRYLVYEDGPGALRSDGASLIPLMVPMRAA